MLNPRNWAVAAVLAATAFAAAPQAWADGTEELNPPDPADLVLADGTGIVTGGVGLVAGQPQDFDVPVPAGTDVVQVLAYWEGQASSALEQGDTDTVMLNGMEVIGDRIGGPTNFFGSVWTSSYRADITELGLVQSDSNNNIEVTGLDFSDDNDGLGVMAIVDDGGPLAVIRCADGNDNAFINFAPPLDITEIVEFEFPPSEMDRDITLRIMVGSIASMRPNTIYLAYGDEPLSEILIDELMDSVGEHFDVYTNEGVLTLPAGAGSLRIQLRSEDMGGPFTGLLPASLTWINVCIELAGEDEPPPPGGEGCTPGFWKQEHHFGHYPAPYTPDTLFSDAFNNMDAFPGMTLPEVIAQGGGGLKALGRHAGAGLLNAASDGVEYDYSVDEVIDGFNAAFAEGTKSAYNHYKDMFAYANEEGCPLDGQSFWGSELNVWPEPWLPGMAFRDVFTGSSIGKSMGTLQKMTGKKGNKGLAAEAVTALLNATSPDSGFPMTPEELVDYVEGAMNGGKLDVEAARQELMALNGAVCPCDLE